MTKKNITLILALLLITSVSMWAQNLNNIAGTVTNTTQNVDSTPAKVGGHVGSGCFFCHTPHSTGTIQQAGTAKTLTATSVNNSTGAAASPQAAGVGLNNAGAIYLWAYAMPPMVYTTWDQSGGSLSTAAVTNASSPAVHSLLCLTCHDTADLAHGPGGFSKLGGPQGSGATAGFGPGSGIAATYYTANSSNQGWASTGSLVTNHPIHALYPVAATDNHYGQYWQVVVTGSGPTQSINFHDAAFVPYVGAGSYVGHPARLYADGAGHAYVECTTCHEPHRQNHVAYQVSGTTMNAAGGTWVVDQTTGSTGSTSNYIRGPWINTLLTTAGSNTGEVNAGFCRSCHYEKTPDYVNNNGGIQ